MASVLQHSVFFIVQLSQPYMTTGKTIALTRRTLVGKVMSLLFNMLSRFVIAFFPRSKRLLISWLQPPSVVILEPQKSKVSHCFHCFPVYHQLPGFTQTHVHRVSDAIQPSHPLSSPSPPAFNLSQHQGLFKCLSSLHPVDKVLEFQLQHHSFQ